MIDIPAGKAGEEAVDVTYTYDINSILEVEVKVVSTQKLVKAVFVGRDVDMTEEEIKELPTTEIKEQTEEQEKEVAKEQEVEAEAFKLQGEIAYEGDRARTWNVELGDYKGLTYYSQLDTRWSSKMYSSVGNSTQTIGTSGCRSNLCRHNRNCL